MNEFKSSVFDSIFSKGIRNAGQMVILYLICWMTDYSGLITFQRLLLGIAGFYVPLAFIQIFLTNNDLIIEEEEIIIRSSLFKGIRKKRFRKEEIEEIIFKDEWSETFMSRNYPSIIRLAILYLALFWIIPPEYKWIKIKTKSKKEFKYYFFGMNYDFYDNTKKVIFEDIFIELAKRNIKVKWKSTKNSYFKGIQEKGDEIFLDVKK